MSKTSCCNKGYIDEFIKSIDNYVLNNNKFKINSFYEKLSNDSFNKLFDENGSVWINSFGNLINACCIIGDLNSLNKLLDIYLVKYEDRKIEFPIGKPTIYHAVKGANMDILKRVIEFSNGQLKRTTNELKFGEYYNQNTDETTLIRAIKNQNFEAVKILIEQCGAGLSLSDSIKRTPLHYAVGLNDIRIVEYLIDCGADINAQSNHSDTPLINACHYKKLDNIRLLINKGANVDIKGNYGNAPIHYIASDCNDQSENFSVELYSILSSANADVCQINEKKATAFARVCGTNNFKMIEIMFNDLRQKYSKNKRHSLCHDPSQRNKLKIISNSEYVNSEIINGIINAACYLRKNTVRYLLDYVDDKRQLSDEIQDLYSNKIVVTSVQRRDISEFNEIFKLFMSFDCFPTNERPYYYTQFLVDSWRVRIHAPDTYSIVPLENCVQEQIKLLIYYGKLKVSEIEDTYKCLFSSYGNADGIKELYEAFINKYDVWLKTPKSLALLSKNAIRKAMISLSDKNTTELNLPFKLKCYLINGTM